MKLILVRHGETDWNKERRYQGQLDVPLNARGRWQAEHAAGALAGLPVDYLISSDLQRALATAEAIGSVCGRGVTADPRLREMSYGKWEGLTVDEIKEHYDGEYRHWRTDPATYPPEGGEGLAAAVRRVEHVLQDVAQVEAETVVLVSHGGTLRILLRYLLGLPPDAYWQFKIENASISTVQISAVGNRLVRMNDTGHLLSGDRQFTK